MKFRAAPNSSAAARRAMTLVEVLVAVAIGSLVLAVVVTLIVFGARSFIALGNYSVLDQQSRLGIDRMTREIRQATAVIGVQTNTTPIWLLITNATKGITVKYAWDPATQELTAKYSDNAAEQTLLTGCERWSFSLWQRTPYANQTNAFHTADTLALCKLVSMNWKCSRSVMGTNLMNTETIQTAQIVLRNQQSK
jgi:Tfp pilus assembly protein PilW